MKNCSFSSPFSLSQFHTVYYLVFSLPRSLCPLPPSELHISLLIWSPQPTHLLTLIVSPSHLESVLLAGESGHRCRMGEGERDADERSASSSETGGVAAADWQSDGGDDIVAVIVCFSSGSATSDTSSRSPPSLPFPSDTWSSAAFAATPSLPPCACRMAPSMAALRLRLSPRLSAQ